MMSIHPSVSSSMNINGSQTSYRPLSNPAQDTMPLNNYQPFLRQNSPNINSSALQPDIPCTLSSPNNPQPEFSFQSSVPSFSGSLKSTPANSLLGFPQQSPQQMPNGLPPQQNSKPSRANQQLQQQRVIQQLLQEMISNNRGTQQQQQPASGLMMNGTVAEEVFGGGIGGSGGPQVRAAGSVGNISFGNGPTMSNNAAGLILSRNSSFRSISGSPTPVGSGSFITLRGDADEPQNISIPELILEITRELTGSEY